MRGGPWCTQWLQINPVKRCVFHAINPFLAFRGSRDIPTFSFPKST
jgi:hypothetical protein